MSTPEQFEASKTVILEALTRSPFYLTDLFKTVEQNYQNNALNTLPPLNVMSILEDDIWDTDKKTRAIQEGLRAGTLDEDPMTRSIIESFYNYIKYGSYERGAHEESIMRGLRMGVDKLSPALGNVLRGGEFLSSKLGVNSDFLREMSRKPGVAGKAAGSVYNLISGLNLRWNTLNPWARSAMLTSSLSAAAYAVNKLFYGEAEKEAETKEDKEDINKLKNELKEFFNKIMSSIPDQTSLMKLNALKGPIGQQHVQTVYDALSFTVHQLREIQKTQPGIGSWDIKKVMSNNESFNFSLY